MLLDTTWRASVSRAHQACTLKVDFGAIELTSGQSRTCIHPGVPVAAAARQLYPAPSGSKSLPGCITGTYCVRHTCHLSPDPAHFSPHTLCDRWRVGRGTRSSPRRWASPAATGSPSCTGAVSAGWARSSWTCRPPPARPETPPSPTGELQPAPRPRRPQQVSCSPPCLLLDDKIHIKECQR